MEISKSGVILFYVVTAIGVFIYLHDEIERKTAMGGGLGGIDIFDVFGPILMAVMWPVMPLIVILMKILNYVVYASLRKKLEEKDKIKQGG